MLKLFRLALLAFIVVWFDAPCLAAANAPEPKFAWSLKAPLIAANSETGIAELDGKIYVIGGAAARRFIRSTGRR